MTSTSEGTAPATREDLESLRAEIETLRSPARRREPLARRRILVAVCISLAFLGAVTVTASDLFYIDASGLHFGKAKIDEAGNATFPGVITGTGAAAKGMIVMWSGSERVPAGWTRCDGTRGTPDLRGRFVLGAGQGSGLTNRRADVKGGAETMTAADMPRHSHSIQTATTSEGDHQHRYVSGWGSTAGIRGGDWSTGEIGYVGTWGTSTSNGAHTHSLNASTNQSGFGSADNNMPPYWALVFIMYCGDTVRCPGG